MESIVFFIYSERFTSVCTSEKPIAFFSALLTVWRKLVLKILRASSQKVKQACARRNLSHQRRHFCC